MALIDMKTREKVVPKDGKFCVQSEDGSRSFGCYDTEEMAEKRLGQVEMFKHQREALKGVDLPLEWVEKTCPSCAKKMKKNGWTSIKAQALFDVMVAREQSFGGMPEQLVKGLCEKYGADPGFFTSCVDDPPEGIDDAESFCAALHIACTGKATGEHRREQDKTALIRMVEAVSRDVEGREWDVVVIREGDSINGAGWGNRRLEEILSLVNATKEGVPVLSFRWETPIGPLRAHSPADLERSGLSERDFVHVIEGAIREGFIGSDAKGRFVGGKLILTKEDTRKELKEAERAGTLKFYGLSVNSQSIAAQREGGKVEMRFVANLPSVDLVHFPSAGGQLIRAVAAAVPPNLWSSMAGSSPSNNTGSTEEIHKEQIMDWLKIVEQALAEAKIVGVLAENIRESAVKNHAPTGDGSAAKEWLKSTIAEFVKLREAVTPPPPPATPPAVAPATVAATTPPPGVSADEFKKFTEQIKNQEAEMAKLRTENWSGRIEAEIKTRGLTDAEAELVREAVRPCPGDDAKFKSGFEKVLKVRESVAWPKSKLGAPGISVGGTTPEILEKSLLGAFKREPVDGVMPARSIKEMYRLCTGVLNPTVEEIMEGLAYSGRLMNSYNREARLQHRAILKKEELEPVRVRESALVAQAMRASPTYAHVAAYREAINLAQFPNVVANVLHNVLQGVYQLADMDAWRTLTDIEIVDDYKSHDFTRVGGYDDAPLVAEGDPYTDVTSPTDEKASATVEKRGDLESITDRAIANDDIGAITATPMKFLMGMKVGFAKRFWDFYKNGNTTVTTYDGVNWFSVATHANLLTGASAAVDINFTNLDLLRKKMREQKVKNTLDTFLGESALPKYLITSPEMEPKAAKFTQKLMPIDNQFQIENQLHGDLARIIVPFWSADGSFINTSWFLQADRSKVFAPIRALFYLSDQPEFFIEDTPTTGVPFTNDKIRYKRRWAYKIVVTDHRQVQAARATS